MVRIKYDVKLENSNNPRVESMFDTLLIEYKTDVSDVRVLQSAIMTLAKSLTLNKSHSAILILDEPRISEIRLLEEWESWQTLFQSSIITRLHIIVFSKDSIVRIYGELTPKEIELLGLIRNDQKEKYYDQRLKKPDSFYELLKVLLIHWFRGTGPLQKNQLKAQTGFSFPTISRALKKLEAHLIRQSSGSVQLKSFPGDDWLRLITSIDKVRSPQCFFAKNPRPNEYIIERIKETAINDIAFGGIVGASHIFPDIDLIGVHRIDLCLHNWKPNDIDSFIRELDPGLKKVDSVHGPQVVIHNLIRPVPFFIKYESLSVADEVECLLDLYEANMQSQANEFYEHLINRIDI